MCFDTNIGYVCHMTACYIFVGMLLLVLFLMWYDFQDIYSIYTVLYVYYLALSFMWFGFTMTMMLT